MINTRDAMTGKHTTKGAAAAPSPCNRTIALSVSPYIRPSAIKHSMM